MNKQTFIKNKAIIVVLLALTIGLPTVFFAGYYSARGAYPSGATPVFEHPIGSYSYLVFNDGGTYRAKNGSIGSIDYSDPNATTLINNVLNALTSGRTTKEKVLLIGDFTISGGATYVSIEIPSYTIFQIQGKLTAANSNNRVLVANDDWVNGNTQIEIIGGEIDGNRANQNPGDETIPRGIYLNSTTNSLVSGVYIHDTLSSGIDLDGGSGNIIENNVFASNGFQLGNNDWSYGAIAISTSTGYNNTIHGNILRGTEDGVGVGIGVLGSYNVIASNIIDSWWVGISIGESGATGIGNIVSDNVVRNTWSSAGPSSGKGCGIVLGQNARRNIVSNNYIDDSEVIGIRIDQTTATENIVEANMVENGVTAIYVYSQNNSIIGNTVRNHSSYGIIVYYGNNTISDNTIVTVANAIELDTAIADASDCIVSGNKLVGAGIIVETSSNVITNNHILGASNGIYLTGASNNTLTANNLRSQTFNGIYLSSDSDYNIIASNRAFWNGNYGVNIDGATNDKNLVHGNILLGNTLGALNNTGTGTVDADNIKT